MDDVTVLIRYSDDAIGLTGWGMLFLWLFVMGIFSIGRSDK